METVVEVIWGTGELSLTSLMIQTIGMLTLEWLEQHTEISKLDGNGIHLPKDLDTEKARKYFAKAIEKKYMTIENDKYRWIGTNDKGNRSELAYFLGKVYKYEHTDNGNAGENFPEESLNNLFGVTRLYSSLTQVYNAQKPQRWRSMIDAMFKQG